MTNPFIRVGENDRVVMAGGDRVVYIREGVYTAADLLKKWLDNDSSGRHMIDAGHVKIVKNVSDSLNLPFVYQSSEVLKRSRQTGSVRASFYE